MLLFEIALEDFKNCLLPFSFFLNKSMLNVLVY